MEITREFGVLPGELVTSETSPGGSLFVMGMNREFAGTKLEPWSQVYVVYGYQDKTEKPIIINRVSFEENPGQALYSGYLENQPQTLSGFLLTLEKMTVSFRPYEEPVILDRFDRPEVV